MQESHDHYFEEESLYHAISRFEDTIRTNSSCYFDVCEFEIIIDYYLEQHNFGHAEEAVSMGLKQHPSANEIKFRMGQLFIQSGKPSKGLKLLRDIEKLESSNSDFYLLKGSALNLLGKSEEAAHAFDLAIQYSIDGKDEVVYNIAYSYINTRRYKLAFKYLKLAYEINPGNISVIQEMAMVCERLDEYEKSAGFYKKYLDIDPFSDIAWLNLGMVYATLNDSEKAIEAYDFAISIRPNNVSALFSKANILVNLGKNGEAIEAYDEILEYEPDNVQALTYIGECYEKINSYKRSIYYFNRAIAIDEYFADAWYGMGIAVFQQENFDESLGYFEKANRLDPENPDYWFMLGEVHRKLDNLEKSAEAFNRVVELDPNDFEAWITRAELSYRENNDLKGAIRIMVKACEYNPEVSIINYQLATYYFRNNQIRQGVRYFEKGLALNFNDHYDYLDELTPRSIRQINYVINKFRKNPSN